MEHPITDQIEKTLDVTDPVKKDRIAAVVHSRVQAWVNDMIEARVSALAKTYTIEELEGYLAFGRSPAGQVLRTAAPELNRELASVVFGQGTPSADGAHSSEQKVALINRILKARDVETYARKGWRVLSVVMAKALSETAKNEAPSAAPVNDQPAEEAYVKRVLAVETQFYSKNFSDEQLSALAAYFDGPIGRAFEQHAPQLISVAASEGSGTFEQQFERMDREACEAIECSTSQQAALDIWLSNIRSMMATGLNAMAN